MASQTSRGLSKSSLVISEIEFGMHFAHYYYVDGLLFPLADNVNNTQRSEGEIGISLRVRKPLEYGWPKRRLDGSPVNRGAQLEYLLVAPHFLRDPPRLRRARLLLIDARPFRSPKQAISRTSRAICATVKL